MSIAKNSPIPMFNFMDGLWDFNKVANIFYCILFIDVMFAVLTTKGVFYFSTENEVKFVLGDVLGVILSFGFFSSLLLIFITLLFFRFLLEVKYKYMKTDDSSDYLRKEYGYVSLSKLHDEALNNQSSFIYNIYHEASENFTKNRKDSQRLEYVSVGIFFLFLIEWYLSTEDGSALVFLDWLRYVLTQYFEDITPLAVNLWCVSIAFMHAVTVCWPRNISSMVYYPPLYEKLVEQEKSRKKREREIEQEYERNLNRSEY